MLECWNHLFLPKPQVLWSWEILPPNGLLNFIISYWLSQIKSCRINWNLIWGSWNKKSMKFKKSPCGNIAHLETGLLKFFQTSSTQIEVFEKKKIIATIQVILEESPNNQIFDPSVNTSKKCNADIGTTRVIVLT